MTRDRLYLEAIEEVYGRSNKVILDSEGSGNLLYLPIDQLMKRSGTLDSRSETPIPASIFAAVGGLDTGQRVVTGGHASE